MNSSLEGHMNRRIEKLMIRLFALALALPLMVKAQTNLFDTPCPDSAYDISRQVRYAYTLSNHQGVPATNVEFLVCAPLPHTSHQWRRRLETSHPALLEQDALGNDLLRFKLDTITPYAQVMIRIKADMLMRAAPADLSPVDPAGVYLGSAPYIESEHAEITALSAKWKRSATKTTVRNFERAVRGCLKSTGFQGHTRSALYALRQKKGDCTEAASLFTALCRAADMPARVMAGYVAPNHAVLEPNGLHNWAEVHNGTTWRIIDTHAHQDKFAPELYIAFKIIHHGGWQVGAPQHLPGDRRHAVFGADLQVHMNRRPKRNRVTGEVYR